MKRLLLCLSLFLAMCSVSQAADDSAWASRLPAGEQPVQLFNGTDLTGWKGDAQYWSVVDGMIRGANSEPVPSSTYLFTETSYRNFRLIFEVKQTVSPQHSTMHSAAAILGEQFTDAGENAFGFKGPLVMFCHDWGVWDAHRRNRIVPRGEGPRVEKKGDWNLIEILVVGNRIRCVANGTQVFDFTDDEQFLQPSPIGLQLHREKRPQEYHFRGLLLSENPKPELVTRTEPIVYTQAPERQPSMVAEAEEAPQESSAELFRAGPNPTWIWGPKSDGQYVLSTTFEGGAQKAILRATCDNVMTVFVNGKRVASSDEWQEPVEVDVTPHLVDGTNTLRAKVANQGGIAAFLAKLVLVDGDDSRRYVVSDAGWQGMTAGNSPSEVAVRAIGKHGDGPWGALIDRDDVGTSGVPRETFVLLPGFEVEKLFTVPKEELGSWVAITVDPQGRIIASDQGGKGLCRITPPAIGSQEPTRVEHLDLEITAAQGLLFAFDSLYISVNGGPGSGLYRARYDAESDTFGPVEKLKAFRGGGEHGPHALRLSPDGESIYVICGNHTDPPFRAGEDAENANYSSRIPTNWGEDLLLPRQWDANGHARGKLAPGGWIARTDPDGETWEIISIGYRNPYDMDFNADGELFAYDADMEWDIGSPWYRPTRVMHATSGSEFGWRSGTGKWPAYYVDSLPELVDIGPGSPVGVCFGYGTKFPARYQQALYLCDWTFGTMYAIHIEPNGASYTATKEEFVSRTPLPLTDNAVGSDGALYFTIGGRGTQSELFRVIYTGEADTSPVDAADKEFAEQRALRRSLEDAHVDGVEGDVAKVVKHLGHEDRHIRYAARLALEATPVGKWQEAVLTASDPNTVITGVVGLARQGEASLKERLSAALERLADEKLTDAQRLDRLRAWQLIFARMGEPEEATRTRLVWRLDPVFPVEGTNLEASSADSAEWAYSQIPMADALNRELVTLLVYLRSPEVIAETVELLKQESRKTGASLDPLLARNRGYGRAIAGMIENQPDLQQVHYAFVLRNMKEGWTLDDRKTYFGWFDKARQWSGGNSFRKFLENIDQEAYLNASEKERLAIEALGARKPFTMPELPKPTGPGQDWTLEGLRALAAEKLSRGRDFENGKKMFAATRCVLCHRFDGDGGATGPDLTQLAGRFNLEALTEAIIDPGKVISDQYRASQLVTTEGKVYEGRIVSETEDALTMLIDPEDATKVIDIPRESIEILQPSQTSLMPKDLLKPLNEAEVLDLLAYLLSRGNPRDPMFRK